MKNTYSEKDRKFLKKIGDRIRKARLMNDISQEELAYLAGLDRTYISGIERGERNISVITIKKLSDALTLEISALLQNKSEQSTK